MSKQVIRLSTRDALIAGAQAVLAEQGPGVPVSAITERAGVAVGSFYNHFESKDDLFREAAFQALATFEDFMVRSTSNLEDPAVVLCTRFRLYCRMPDSHPQIAWILANSAPRLLGRPQGFSPKAADDVQRAVDAGRLDCDDIPLRLMTVAGGANRVNSMRLLDPSIPPTRADDFAAVAMELLGLPHAEARAMAAVPLDELLN